MLTNKYLRDLLPKMLHGIETLHRDRPDLIVAAWPDVVGERLAVMTQAIGFEQGILSVKVSNSTLYSILARQEREALLKKLRQKFPSVLIKNIRFRMG